MTKETVKEMELIAREEREVEGIYPEDAEPEEVTLEEDEG